MNSIECCWIRCLKYNTEASWFSLSLSLSGWICEGVCLSRCIIGIILTFHLSLPQTGGELLYLWGRMPPSPRYIKWIILTFHPSLPQAGGELLYLWGRMSPPLYSVRTLSRLLSAEIPGARVCRNFWKGKEQTCYLQNHLNYMF